MSEELDNLISVMVNVYNKDSLHAIIESFAQAIIDAGYRKPDEQAREKIESVIGGNKMKYKCDICGADLSAGIFHNCGHGKVSSFKFLDNSPPADIVETLAEWLYDYIMKETIRTNLLPDLIRWRDQAVKEERDRIVTVYDEYIQLLTDELNEIVPMAAEHGWKTHRYDKGEELRAKIEALKEQEGQ